MPLPNATNTTLLNIKIRGGVIPNRNDTTPLIPYPYIRRELNFTHVVEPAMTV